MARLVSTLAQRSQMGSITLASNKFVEKTGEILAGKAFEQGGKVMKLLKRKSPETASELEAAAENPALPPGQPEYIGEAVCKDSRSGLSWGDLLVKCERY